MRANDARLVVEARDDALVVAYRCVDAVVERAPPEHEAVVPAHRHFPAVGAHVGGVLLGRRYAVDARKGGTWHHHVGGAADVVVGRGRKAVVEERQVEAGIVGGDLFPGEVGGHGVRFGGVLHGVHAVEGEVVGEVARRDFIIKKEVRHLLVAERAHGEAQFGVVPPLRYGLPEFFLAHAPTQRARGKETPAVTLAETRRTVAARRELKEIAAREVVVHTAEYTERLRCSLAAGEGVGLTHGKVEIVEFVAHKALSTHIF